MKDGEHIVWRCPKCRWLIGDACYRQSRIAYPCGGCGNTTLPEFNAYVIPGWRKPTKEELEKSLGKFRQPKKIKSHDHP